MTSIVSFCISDIKTVVPAVTPSWIQLIIRVEFKSDDGTIERHWLDEIYQVLAYGIVCDKWTSYSAFLVHVNRGELIWIAQNEKDNQCIILHFEKPEKGTLPPGNFCEGYIYEPTWNEECEASWIYK